VARRIPYQVAGAIDLPTERAANWFAVLEVGEQGKTRVRLAKRDVARFRGTQGERLDQLQLPTFKTVK